jgi:hypothetical protein
MSKGTNTLGTTQVEARAEAERIMAYWHNLGYLEVKVSIAQYHDRNGSEYICGWRIESNLVKGRPVGLPVKSISTAARMSGRDDDCRTVG